MHSADQKTKKRAKSAKYAVIKPLVKLETQKNPSAYASSMTISSAIAVKYTSAAKKALVITIPSSSNTIPSFSNYV